VDTAVQYKPLPIHVNARHLKPSGGGRLQLPPLDIKSANKLRPATSFGDLVNDEGGPDQSTLSQRRLRLKKGNSENGPGVKELRSLSIALPPNSQDAVSHLVSPLPSHRQFRHTESIQRYDDEVQWWIKVLLLNVFAGGVFVKSVPFRRNYWTCKPVAYLITIFAHTHAVQGSYGVVRRATTDDTNEVKVGWSDAFVCVNVKCNLIWLTTIPNKYECAIFIDL